ncbi:MAG: hypothetical protein V5A39_03755 [Haloarculaceae archaeon]
MRYKVVPEPVSYDLLLAARDALPLVPGSVEDCCGRIRDRTEIPSRDAAREWLTFLQALGLAAETDRGFYRGREEPDRDTLAEQFLDGVFGAHEIRDALAAADGPLAAREVFGRVRETIPHWERDRRPDWESEWTGRIERLLDWGVVFEILERREGGYVAVR